MTTNHGKIKVEPKNFYPLNFNGIVEKTLKDLLRFECFKWVLLGFKVFPFLSACLGFVVGFF
jgi:hypothetical protein